MPSETMLAKAIREAEMTLGEVADAIRRHTGGRLEPTRNQVSEWQTGKVRPRDDYVEALAAVLDLDKERLARDLDDRAKERKRRIMEDGPAPVAQLRSVRNDMKRRKLLQAGSIVAAAAAIDTEPLRLLQAAGRPLANGVIDGLEAITEHYAHHFWLYPADDLDDRLTAQLVEVRTLLEGRATIAERVRLCLIGARLAVLLARARWNRGRIGDSSLYLGAAYELAEQAGDRPMMALVFGEEATVAYYDRRYAAAVELAEAGRHAVRSGDVLVDLSAGAARAAARIGNGPAATEAIQATQRALDAGEVASDDDLFSINPAGALHRIAAAELWLGDAVAAKATALAAIAASDGEADRTVNEPHARMTLAGAEIRLGNLDAGIGEATAVLTARPSSTAFVARGRELLADLTTHTREPLVTGYRDLLDSFTRQALPGTRPTI